jgi:hypothetical protein
MLLVLWGSVLMGSTNPPKVATSTDIPPTDSRHPSERAYAGRVALYRSYCARTGVIWNRPGFFELGGFAHWLVTEPLPPRTSRLSS